MRYVSIPLPWITGGKPGIVYSARAARFGMRLGSDLRLDLYAPAFHLARALWCAASKRRCLRQRLGLNLPVGGGRLQQYFVDTVTPLPADFLEALAKHDEVLVTSREGTTRGTVPTWFVIAPPGVVYLFSFAFSEKARRWRADPWVRLSVPGEPARSVEGAVHVVEPADVDDVTAMLIVDRWAMQGAPTVEGLRRTLRDRVHVLVRVEGQSA